MGLNKEKFTSTEKHCFCPACGRDESDESRFEGNIEMSGMERQSLHSTAFSLVYYGEKINDLELSKAARDYLLRVLSE